VLLIALLGTAFLVEAGSPSISLSPNRGRGGTVVTVNGSGFPVGGARIYVFWDFGDSTQALEDNFLTRTGTFSVTFTVPRGGGHFGANTVHACPAGISSGPPVCSSSSPGASATFTIPKSHVTVSPSHGRAGMESVANGFDYFSLSVFQLTWDPAGAAQNLGSGRTDSGGGISLPFTIPKGVAPGKYTIQGCTTLRSGCAKNDTHTATFFVTSPTLAVNPNHGMAGDKIATSGKNYWPSALASAGCRYVRP